MYRRKLCVDRRDFADRNARPQMEIKINARTTDRFAADDNFAATVWDEDENFNAVREYQLLAISLQLTARSYSFAFCVLLTYGFPFTQNRHGMSANSSA